jgi:hypothetical protein
VNDSTSVSGSAKGRLAASSFGTTGCSAAATGVAFTSALPAVNNVAAILKI